MKDQLLTSYKRLSVLKQRYRLPNVICDFDDQPSHPVTLAKKDFVELWLRYWEEGNDSTALLIEVYGEKEQIR